MFKSIKNKIKTFKSDGTAFTLVELIVVIAVIGILVLVAAPKFISYTQKAELTKIRNNVKVVETAAGVYHVHNEDWPRLTDVPYTAEELTEFAEKIYSFTGEVIELDVNGNFYNIDWGKMSPHMKKPKDAELYILQNPVGKVFYLNNLTQAGKNALKIIESGTEDGAFKLDRLKITKMVSGNSHTLSLMSDGTVVAFGENGVGQLGHGHVSERLEKEIDYSVCETEPDPFMCEMELEMNYSGPEYEYFEPAVVAGLANIVDIATFENSSMALASDGRVYTWGENHMFLNSSVADGTIASPIIHPSLSDIKMIFMPNGIDRAKYAVKTDGTVLAWGFNDYLYGISPNLPKYAQITMPTVIPELHGAVHIIGHQALLGNGSVVSWGDGDFFTVNASIPNITKLTGESNTVVLTGDKKVFVKSYKLWGNSSGQLGLGHTNSVTNFTEVIDLRGATEIYTSVYQTFAVMSDGRMLAAGNNQDGGLGIGSSAYTITTFTEIVGIHNPKAITFDKMKGLTTIVNGDGNIYVLGKGSLTPELTLE